ncbi:uncharacterized protein LOC129927135 [Biomphalaria glabrata]|uniref:Uncharacterized protein LOC129927135 n=1 Tax=Biomphalaria glabrata TaxID=6526 RepID=A0A9W3AT06_BIOGL|nr:uncharacterized protein LOC129927135 [Biomphalaria glabrata]
MRASLWQALVDEGEDPETYLFEIEPDIGEVLNTLQNWLCELCTFQDSMNHSMDKLIRNVQGQVNPDPYRSTYEGNLNFDCCIQAVSNNSTCGASRRECKCQETHQQGLKPVDFDTSVFTSERGPEGGQKNPAADGLLHLKRCKGALQTILPETAEADSLLNSVASCGSTALSRVILRKGLMKRSSESTALTTTRAVTTTRCVRWLTPATTVRMERPRLRHRVERNLVNWRRKRHLQRAVWIALWGTRSLPSVAPTDRPPPALTNVHHPVGHLNLFGTNRSEKGAML